MVDLGNNLSPQDGAPPPARRQGKNMGPLRGQKTQRIMVEESSEIPPTGLFVGVNGYGYMIKPGVVIDAPMAVIEVLNNAIITVPIVNPDTLQITGTRSRRRFSYRSMEGVALD
jgi:hypothetical protein